MSDKADEKLQAILDTEFAAGTQQGALILLNSLRRVVNAAATVDHGLNSQGVGTTLLLTTIDKLLKITKNNITALRAGVPPATLAAKYDDTPATNPVDLKGKN